MIFFFNIIFHEDTGNHGSLKITVLYLRTATISWGNTGMVLNSKLSLLKNGCHLRERESPVYPAIWSIARGREEIE